MARNIDLVDIDVYGRNSTKGGALEHRNDLAVSNAIIHYLNSGVGDYLFDPNRGGGVREQLFKLMNTARLGTFTRDFKAKIEEEFGDYVANIQIDIIPDFDSRTLEIFIYWVNLQTNESNDLAFFLLMPSNLQRTPKPENTGDLIGIDYVGDNLIAFVALELEKPELQNSKMTFDTKRQKYVWGPYVFNGLTDESSEFIEIDSLIGF